MKRRIILSGVPAREALARGAKKMADTVGQP
jgi:hypothetical protein